MKITKLKKKRGIFYMKVNYKTVFSKEIAKKIDKTREARTGKGIYKRRNSRNYRVVMSLRTYRKLFLQSPSTLSEYGNGYIVRIKPEEYFSDNSLTDIDIKLGVNAFVYYKSARDLRNFPPNENWTELVEIFTSNDNKKIEDHPEFVGEVAYFVNNTQPRKVSKICETGDASKLSAKEIEDYISEYNLKVGPKKKQAGIGNFDYDYCTDEEMKNVQYQLSYLIFAIEGMKDYLSNLFEESPGSFDSKLRSKSLEEFRQIYEKTEQHVIKYCRKHGLLNFDLLSDIGAISDTNQRPICPLCKQSVTAEEFIEVEEQAEGREEEDNTRSKIALMHINALQPGEFNHHTYNLAWGHRWCNQIQEDKDIDETVNGLIQMLKGNGYIVSNDMN